MILLATIYSDILNRYCCIISQENLAACCQNSRLSTPNIFSFLTGFNGKHCIFCNVSYYNGACFFVINQGKCISSRFVTVSLQTSTESSSAGKRHLPKSQKFRKTDPLAASQFNQSLTQHLAQGHEAPKLQIPPKPVSLPHRRQIRAVRNGRNFDKIRNV